MKIRAGYEIACDCPQPTPMILTLSVHPTRFPDLLTRDHMRPIGQAAGGILLDPSAVARPRAGAAPRAPCRSGKRCFLRGFTSEFI
jgi:hypothetical protein